MQTRHLALILAVLVAAGCVVAVYATTELIRASNRQGEAHEAYEVTYKGRETIRLLAAVVPRDQEKKVWFFRLSGPTEVVTKQKDAFDQFLASVRFDDKQEPPFTWKAPEGWKHERGAGMRLATFRIDAGPRPLELTVTALGPEAGNLLDNVNRWRKQINLPPLEDNELDQNVKPRQIGGEPGSLVDFTGLGKHTVNMPAPVAKGGHPDIGAVGAMPPSKLPFTYDLPKGWQRSRRNSSPLIAETLLVGDDEKPAIVTLSQAGGDLAANINRWRGQLGLPEVPPAEAIRSAADRAVDGKTVKYVDLANPKAPPGRPGRFLIAVVPHEGQSWFLKMYGPADAVGAHQAEFESFVKSLKFVGR